MLRRRRSPLNTAALGCWGLLVPLAPSAMAQERLENTVTDARCGTCVFTIREVATLGSDSGPGILANAPRSIVRDVANRYWVAVYAQNEPAQIYDTSGRWIRAEGRGGRGPREYLGQLTLLRSLRDTIYIIDEGNRRVSVFTPTGTFARAYRFESSVRDAVVAADGTVILHANRPTPEAAGLPFHVIAGEPGHVARSFGARVPVLRADRARSIDREIAPARCGFDCSEIWSARPTRYEIERWDYRTGELKASVSRRPDWFEPHWEPEIVPAHPDRTPPAYIRAISEDPSGRLWVYLLAPDPEWRRALGSPQVQRGTMHYPVEDWDAYYDTMVEVLWPETGEVIAGARIDRVLPIVIDFSHAAALDLEALGVAYRVRVWEITLSDAEGRE